MPRIMSSITFDTFKFVERLEKAGATRELAAALVEVQKESIAEVIDSQLATKSDLRAVKDELKTDIYVIRTEMAVIKWMMGAMLGIGLTILFKLFS